MCHVAQCGAIVRDVHVEATRSHGTAGLLCVILEHNIC